MKNAGFHICSICMCCMGASVSLLFLLKETGDLLRIMFAFGLFTNLIWAYISARYITQP